jgi:hypothetical protein
MARSLLVAPAAEGVGLARTCLGLLRALDRRGIKVAFVKPVAQPPSGGHCQPLLHRPGAACRGRSPRADCPVCGADRTRRAAPSRLDLRPSRSALYGKSMTAT